MYVFFFFFFFQAEDGIRDYKVTGVQTCALPISNLAIVGSHSTNGVAAIHSALLRSTTVKDLAEMFPERFGNKTNGVTPRRWLLLSNPSLARTITESIGDDWISDLGQLATLKPLADDASFRDAFLATKRDAKSAFAQWLRSS